MIKNPSTLLRSALALSLILVSPGFSSYAAAAQLGAARVTVSGNLSLGSAGAVLQRSGTLSSMQAPLFSTRLTPLLTSGLAPAPALSAEAAAGMSLSATIGAVPVLSAEAFSAEALLAPAAEAPTSSIGALREAVSAETPAAPTGWSIGRLFDGLGRRGVVSEPSAVAGGVPAVQASNLPRGSIKRSEAAGSSVAAPRLAPSKSRGFSRLGKVGLAAALMLATPAIAMAAAPVGATAASAVLLLSLQPIVTALAAVIGAIYGLIAAHRKGDASPSAGELLSSVLRYGIMAGAGTFVLLDVTNILFMGFSAAALTPLPTALATAALGQSAFQGKFSDPATSTADRLIGAFPAVAAALGLSIGLMLSAPAIPLFALALNAMSVTAVMSAVYAAVYQPGKSAQDGPAIMARGYVLQSLMTGLALAVAGPELALPFAALAAWGFWGVMSTTMRELVSRLPESVRRRFRRG